MSACPEAEDDRLYQDADVWITPSWLSVGGTRYAIRTVARLDYQTYRPPTTAATLVFAAALLLIAICLWYLLRNTVPLPLAWGLLIASTALMLYAAWHAFAIKPSYQIMVTLLNGGSVLIKRHTLVQAQGLYQGMTEAMDWHVGGDILINADSEQTSQMDPASASPRLRHSVATGRAAVTASKKRSQQVIPFLSVLHHKSRKQ